MIARIYWLALALVITGCGGGESSEAPPVQMVQAMAPVPATATATTKKVTAPLQSPTVNCSVDLRGTSVLHGGNMQGGLEFTMAARMRQWRPKWSVEDNAVNGQTITDTIDQFENTYLAARFVVIEWGPNDVLHGLDFKQPLRRAVHHVHASGRLPIMTGLHQSAWGLNAAADIVEAVSREEEAPSAHWEQFPTEPVNAATGDLHPAQAYSDVLAGRIVEVIDLIAPECK